MQSYWSWLIFGFVGFLCALGSIGFYYFGFPIILQARIGQTLQITEGSVGWNRYKKLPAPLTFKVYFFNLMNEQDFINGAKPIVSEVGPYVYNEYVTNHNVTSNEETGTITGYKRTRFEFDQNASYPLSDEDIVHPFNFIIENVLQIFLRLGPGLETTAELLETTLPKILGSNYGTVIHASVRQLMFDGIPLKCNDDSYGTVDKLVCSAIKHYPSQAVRVTEDGDMLISIYNFKNSTDSGALEISTGVKDYSKLGEIISYQGSPTVNAWTSTACNTIKGSFDDTLVKPFLTKSSVIPLFMVDACRSVDVVFNGTMSYQGIDGYTFVPSGNFLEDVTQLPDNYCYCPGSKQNITQPQGCLHRGAIDLSSCLGPPAVISFPHFYTGSPLYVNSVVGLSPNKKKHGSFFNLEPNTGVPLSGARRVQVNFQVSREASMRMFRNITSTIIPLMWFDEGWVLDEKDIELLQNELLRSLSVVKIVVWVTVAVGCLIATVAFTMACIRHKQRRRHQE